VSHHDGKETGDDAGTVNDCGSEGNSLRGQEKGNKAVGVSGKFEVMV